MMRLQGEWILLLPPAQGGGAWSGLVKKQMMKDCFPGILCVPRPRSDLQARALNELLTSGSFTSQSAITTLSGRGV